MTQQHHLNHAAWDCKYHVVFIPKYRKKAIFGSIKKNLGAVFHDFARRRESRIEEGHLMPDHVHMLVSIPPKYSVAEGDRVHQGQKLDMDCAEYRAKGEELHRAQILGTRVFGLSQRWEGTRRRCEPTSGTRNLQDRQMDQQPTLIP